LTRRDRLGVPAVWSRELDPGERSLRWCLLIDKHSSYLGACSSLELGIGHPWRFDRPTFDGRTPGYWRIDGEASPWPIDKLPDPLGRDHARARAQLERWVCTPTLELALQLGIELEIREAWLWPKHGRLLRPFYDRCRRARIALEELLANQPSERRRVAAVGALDALKKVYKALLGGYLASKREQRRSPRRPWYRPDWRHAVIAKARANLLRNVQTWAAHGVVLGAIYNDGVYVLSDQLAPPSAVRLDGTLGGYSIKGSWPTERMIGRRGRIVPSLAWGQDEPE
jgi:hypothetical protein